MESRDRRWVEVAGPVLVRRRPGSAKGVMYITIEDETRAANLVVWTKVFEAHRRVFLGAGMIGVRGRVQREGEVVHLIANGLTDHSEELGSVARRDSGSEESPISVPGPIAQEHKNHAIGTYPRSKDMADPHGHIDEIRVWTRDFPVRWRLQACGGARDASLSASGRSVNVPSSTSEEKVGGDVEGTFPLRLRPPQVVRKFRLRVPRTCVGCLATVRLRLMRSGIADIRRRADHDIGAAVSSPISRNCARKD